MTPRGAVRLLGLLGPFGTAALGACGLGAADPPAAARVLGPATPERTLRVACTPGAPERCGDARDGDCNGLIDEGCGLRTGLVQFVAAWSAPTADVDLQVTDAAGELAEVGRPTAAGLFKERDCPGPRGECGGRNVENVALEDRGGRAAPRGTYRVKVRLEKLGAEEPPIRVDLGVRLGPKVYAVELELLRPEDQREIAFVL